jgi:GntR family transcriptional regulator
LCYGFAVMRRTSYKFAPLGQKRPVVQRVGDELRELLRADRMQPGDRIPSETELAERFVVSRGTVREALKLLEQDGLIDVQHGLGRFVSASAGLLVDRPVTRFESVTEMLRSRGITAVNRILGAVRTEPSDEERAALHLPVGREVVRVRRLRRHNHEALVFSINTFSSELLGEEQLDSIDFSGSLVDWFEARGHRLVSSAAQIRAVPKPADLMDFPDVSDTQPWLLITERCVDANGAPVLFSQDFHRGDIFAFHVLRRRET